MKEILMSIQARHNRNIEAGIKRSELRKRIPKCNYPIKVYTYESGFDGRHKVVNEWICRTSTEWRICMGIPAHLLKRACVSVGEIREYSGKNYDNITEMEISDLKIYDKPKELDKFKKAGFMTEEEWLHYILIHTVIMRRGQKNLTSPARRNRGVMWRN